MPEYEENNSIRHWNNTMSIPELLIGLGEDLEREGLLETPDRVMRAWKEFLEGYTLSADDILDKTFDAEDSGLQVCQNIVFTSLCEHHLLSFYGHVTIAYKPRERVCGLSKLARLVDCFARRLQIQERMTSQIANAIWENLNPMGVLVIAEAKHLCCIGRGVKRDKMNFKTMQQYGKLETTDVQLLLNSGENK